MPKGMCLKSEGFASDLYDPRGEFRLQAYCAEKHLDYADIGLPVKVETFIDYGLEFQQRYVPSLEHVQVTGVRQLGDLFEVTTDTGERIRARNVVVAAGITHFTFVPPQLSELPQNLVGHSLHHSALQDFKGRKVAVLGGGASAIDHAVLLQKAGADVELVARRPVIRFHEPPVEPRPLIERIKAPRSGLGLGWRSRMCSDMPLVFHAMPQSLRLKAVKSHLGPAPCWFTKESVVGRLPMRLGTSLVSARAESGGVELTIRQQDQSEARTRYDHVIAATGYKVALSRLQFLDSALRSQIHDVAETPILNRHFESSVPGLHFVGLAAANSFGPVQRFAFGAGFAARRVSRYLASRGRSREIRAGAVSSA
jgi:hypothetical protein